jgi:hypothetical protein
MKNRLFGIAAISATTVSIGRGRKSHPPRNGVQHGKHLNLQPREAWIRSTICTPRKL